MRNELLKTRNSTYKRTAYNTLLLIYEYNLSFLFEKILFNRVLRIHLKEKKDRKSIIK